MSTLKHTILGAFLLIFSTPLLAVDLNLSGTVAAVTSLSVTATGGATSLDIVNGEAGSTVANAVETCNDIDGFTITMSSTSGGKLTHTGNASYSTDYYIRYGVASSYGYQQPTIGGVTANQVNGPTGLVSNNVQIDVNVDALASAPAGVYTDTVVFTITAQ